MKVHVSFDATNLAKSVAFYSTLLDAEPLKLLADYALFATSDPGLELALDSRERVVAAADVHYGLCVENAKGVERAIARLRRAGLVSSIERDKSCCYAKQTKVWANDPDGRRWEVYTVHEETVARDGSQESCCASNERSSCCVE